MRAFMVVSGVLVTAWFAFVALALDDSNGWVVAHWSLAILVAFNTVDDWRRWRRR